MLQCKEVIDLYEIRKGDIEMKVVVFFATGYEEIEALSVVDVLRRGGVEVLMAGVDSDCVTSGRGIAIKMDILAEQIDYDTVDMVVIPGGIPGVDHLYASEVVRQQLASFKAQDKWIGAICAAPGVLGKLGLLKGEVATCYPGVEGQLEGAEVSAARVAVSNKIITGIGAGASLEFALELLEALAGTEQREKVEKGMLIQVV